MKIAGFFNGHDSSFCFSENGIPIIHSELERNTRIKHDNGDTVELADKIYPEWTNCDVIVSCPPINKFKIFDKSWQKIKSLNKSLVLDIPHHTAHAASSFYSSNFDKALIITWDGGGRELEIEKATNLNVSETACTIHVGLHNKLYSLMKFPTHRISDNPNPAINIGGLWSRVCRYVFQKSNGKPWGDSSGTIMCMPPYAKEPARYIDDFKKMLTIDLIPASQKPQGQYEPFEKGKDPKHPYLDKWVNLGKNEEELFNLAAGLQTATEMQMYEIIKFAIIKIEEWCQDNNEDVYKYIQNLCLAGGCTLNTVAMGKITTWFPLIKNIYIPPAPGDGGLTIGASQYFYHHIKDSPRIKWPTYFSPYLGKNYILSDVENALNKNKNKIIWKQSNDDEVIKLLEEQNIISIFNGRAETGARALLSRSIIADPRFLSIKDKINNKIKSREKYRPFAPSVLSENVLDFFDINTPSPYMSFVFKVKEDKKKLIPAVIHVDGTSRIQTVYKEMCPWGHSFITKWYKKTNIPMILNTSFNKQEPIVESPENALECFLRTELDYLYLPEYGILVEKNK